MTQIDRDLSERAAIGAEASQCWNNAWQAIQYMPELADGYYCEGWAVTTTGLLIEHGWAELDGKVIDPTIPEMCQAYFTGLRLDKEAARRAIVEYPPNEGKPELDLPLVWRVGGWAGSDHAGYMQAHQAALEFMRS